jgi:serine/threonine-protein kinase
MPAVPGLLKGVGLMDSGVWLADRYKLEQRIDASQATEVWRAWDKMLSRPVVVKLVAADLLPTPVSLSRLRERIMAAAALSHRGMVTIYDYDETTDGEGAPLSYIVMELVEGLSLADRIRDGALPVTTAIQACAQVAEALAAVHRAGIMHGDIKPSKIMLTSEGARVLSLSVAEESEWYSLGYTSPEQTTGGPVTPAADVYALGLVLTECLTGEREPQTPLPATLPPETALLCARCRSTVPQERPSAAEAAAILRESAESLARPIPPPPDPPTVTFASPITEPPTRTNYVGPASLIVASLALVVAAFALTGRHQTATVTAAPSGAGQTAAPADPVPTAAGQPEAPIVAVPTTPVTSVTVRRVISALTLMDPIVDQGLNTNEIRDDVALDLHNVIGNLKRQLISGDSGSLRTGVEALHEKISTRLREGAISQSRAAELHTALSNGS